MEQFKKIEELEKQIEEVKEELIAKWTFQLKVNGFEVGNEYPFRDGIYKLDRVEVYDSKGDYINKAGVEASRFSPKVILHKVKEDGKYSKRRAVIYKLNLE